MTKLSGSSEAEDGGGQPIAWPWYVRWLATAYVVSLLLGPVGFIVMLCVAGYLIVRDGPKWDGLATVAVAVAWAFPLGCAIFRWWFRSWGRRRWPTAEPGRSTTDDATFDSGKETRMEAFGVRFTWNDPSRFDAIRSLLAEVKRDKDAGQFRDPNEWVRLVPDAVKSRFVWPTQEEQDHWRAVRDSTVIAISNPSDQLGSTWNFFAVFEAIEDGDYDLLECVPVSEAVAEVRIDPHGYPYGGVGPFIALAEAFGFTVIGVNEYGKYESRDRLLG